MTHACFVCTHYIMLHVKFTCDLCFLESLPPQLRRLEQLRTLVCQSNSSGCNLHKVCVDMLLFSFYRTWPTILSSTIHSSMQVVYNLFNTIHSCQEFCMKFEHKIASGMLYKCQVTNFFPPLDLVSQNCWILGLSSGCSALDFVNLSMLMACLEFYLQKNM